MVRCRLRLSQVAGTNYGFTKPTDAHPLRKLLSQELPPAGESQQGTQTGGQQQHQHTEQQLRSESECHQQWQCKWTHKEALRLRSYINILYSIISRDILVLMIFPVSDNRWNTRESREKKTT